MSTNRNTALIVLFNHNYEKNIDIIKKIYKDQFPLLRIIMPFYYGNDPEIISVYGNSFTFQTYIAQAREKLQELECDDILIIGDDLLLNPEINSHNIHDKLNIPNGAFYIDKIENVSNCDYYRPILEATKFSPHPAGLDTSANRILPSYSEALQILAQKGFTIQTKLSKWNPFYPEFKKPFFNNLYSNYKCFKGRIWHLLKVIQYRLKPVNMPYPYVFGYSDIIMIPKDRLIDFSRYLEVFATWNMFVEMAIPTAMLLQPDSVISYAENHSYKTGNVWYPQNPVHYTTISGIINSIIQNSHTIDDLSNCFPSEYLYLHPVKLSHFVKND